MTARWPRSRDVKREKLTLKFAGQLNFELSIIPGGCFDRARSTRKRATRSINRETKDLSSSTRSRAKLRVISSSPPSPSLHFPRAYFFFAREGGRGGNSRRKLSGFLSARGRENLLALALRKARATGGNWKTGTYQCPLRRICHSRAPRRVSRCPEASYCKSRSTLRAGMPCSTDPDQSPALPAAAKTSSPIENYTHRVAERESATRTTRAIKSDRFLTKQPRLSAAAKQIFS